MEVIGGVAGLILFAKIIIHLFLLSKVSEDFTLFSANPNISMRMARILILPSFENVPEKYRLLKSAINILYVIAIVGLIIFLVVITAKQVR